MIIEPHHPKPGSLCQECGMMAHGTVGEGWALVNGKLCCRDCRRGLGSKLIKRSKPTGKFTDRVVQKSGGNDS